MSTPKAKAPTNKVFHFPKGEPMPADEPKQDAAKPATGSKTKAAPAKPASVKKAATTRKAPQAKAAPKTEAKSEAKSETKTQPKTSKVAKPAKADAGKKTAAVKTPKADTGKKAAAAPAVADKAKRVKKDVKKDRPTKVEKVVRDSFTMPKSDYAKLASLKQKCLDEGVHVKKSELLRAGLLLLEAAPIKRLLAAIGELETVKTGRPANT